ncbi:hypothetical protein [Polynucleobacter sp. MWH-UH2A]|uniref:hypothetical protein n=1 Tax=Polynucleobacter sp. MWH-UH2A TaxID=1855617 RepID=UPI001BFD654E|nr:hypothetical protein [Polynucleobacter sp. MWH-UH2A]QWD63845.1 hypothetical protein IC571_09205 [Polynucleobacter sp. MWH-UH2A]
MTFSPSAKISYGLNNTVDVGMEYYADNLPIKGLFSVTQQPNTVYLVMDAKYKKSTFNFGVGKGVTAVSDNWVVKFIAAPNFD